MSPSSSMTPSAKGCESWAWYGLQPINELTLEGGTVLVTSIQPAVKLLEDIHVKDVPYKLAIVNGAKSFSGLWVYKDDHSDVRILGALANVCPQAGRVASLQGDHPGAVGRRAKSRVCPTLLCQGFGSSGGAWRGQSRRAVQVRQTWLDSNGGSPGHKVNRGRCRVPGWRRWLRADPERGLQEMVDQDHEAGCQFRDLYQVHALLAAVPGLVFRRHAGKPL